MKSLLREAAAGILIRLGRTMAFLIVCSSLRRYPPPVRQPPPPVVATQPVAPLMRDDRHFTRTAADVETAARVKLGWPE